MKVVFYFDPSCPFSWITSRWLLQAQTQRDIEIDWRPLSLALKNNHLDQSTSDETWHAQQHRAAHRILRVMLAANQAGLSLISGYSAFGMHRHVKDHQYSDKLIEQVLEDLNLPAELIQAADDSSYDQALKDYIQLAIKSAGPDIGVPVIAFPSQDGQEIGYFGPVLNSLPSHEDGLKLWDGLSSLASSSQFYELKRSRPDGQPDTASTAGLFN